MTCKELKKKIVGDSGLTEGDFIIYQAKVQANNKVYFKQTYTQQNMQNLYSAPLNNLYKISKYYVRFSSYYGNTTLNVGNFKTMQTITAISGY